MIYKNLLPDDYSNIRKNSSIIFQSKKLPTNADGKPIYTPRENEMYKIISDFLKQSLIISKTEEKPAADNRIDRFALSAAGFFFDTNI